MFELIFSYKLLILLVLLVISAFFSGSETAFFSLDEVKLKEIEGEEDKRSKRIIKLLKDPKKLLITILTGNTIVNVAIASIATLIALDVAREMQIARSIVIWTEIIIITILVLVFAEVSPKLAAVKKSSSMARGLATPLSVAYTVLNPIARLFYGVTDSILKLFGLDKKRVSMEEEQMRTLVDVGEEKGTLEEEERRMLHNIFELGDTLVREIMVPRTDLTMISVDAGIKGAIEAVRINRHSRIPVYGESVDDILGILYTRDLLAFLDKRHTRTTLKKLLRRAHFVPEMKKIDELLKEFQEEKRKFALVVDEYGGLSGLVTLEDILEEIIGEIQDEHDDEEPIFKSSGKNMITADARWDLDDMEDELDVGFPTDGGFDSLGGFLFSQFGDIPDKGEEIIYKGIKFTIAEVQSNRITKVLIDSSNKIIDEETEED